jgi:hypothetical protein
VAVQAAGYENLRHVFITWNSSRITVITVDMLNGGYAGIRRLMQAIDLSAELQ